MKDGRLRIVSPGHEEAGGPLTERFLERIGAPLAIRERVLPLVMNHLAHLQTVTDRSVRRLAKRLEPATIDELLVVIAADQFGRPPKPKDLSAEWRALKMKAGELQLRSSAPRPLLMGRHLLELGMTPGRDFGAILEAAFEAQLEGTFLNLDQAWQWLASQKDGVVPAPAKEKLAVKLNASSNGDDAPG
jgi:tRNA nucleotidyltransferase (CCA-adding enzyme)